VPSVALEAGNSEGIPLYLNNYWLLNQTGTYQVTCVINLDVSLWSRDKNYNFDRLSATNKIEFEIVDGTTNEIIDCLNEYLVSNESKTFLKRGRAEAVASLKSPIAIEYLKKAAFSKSMNSGYWVAKGLMDMRTPDADAAMVWALTNGTLSVKENIVMLMGNEKYFIFEALPIIKEFSFSGSGSDWLRQLSSHYVDLVHKTD